MEQKEGHGGWAGIRVPWIDINNNGQRDEQEQAELNLYGEGTVIAIGGDAGNGVNSSVAYGGGRRWSEPEQESEEIGGKGGNANSSQTALLGHNMEFVNEPFKDGSNPTNNTNCAWDGENGESCGIVKIHENVKIYSYGGAGGSGGNGVASSGGGRRRISSGLGIGRWSELVGGRRKPL